MACLFLVGASTDAAEVRIESSILTISESAQVPAPHAGVLREVRVREGMRLKRGEAIARIDAREQAMHADVVRQDLEAARLESQSDIRVRLAKKENKVAEAELQRATSVNDELPNTVSAKEVDRLRLALERTELEIEHAGFENDLLKSKLKRIEADLALAQHLVDRMQIASPVAGVVAEVHKRTGEWVDAGEPIARVVRVDRLRIEGFVGVAEALSGLVGRPVSIEARLPDGAIIPASGQVVFVSPEAEPVDAKVRFWAEIDNRDYRLRPGLTARVVIHESAESSTAAKRRGDQE